MGRRRHDVICWGVGSLKKIGDWGEWRKSRELFVGLQTLHDGDLMKGGGQG